jgi:hypothetical protein
MSDPVSPLPAKPTPLELLNRWSNGDNLYTLAAELNCHPSTLYKQMLRAGGPDAYYEAKVAAHQMNVWRADEKIDAAANMLEFNKAHARAKLARQDYERSCPKEYGQKAELGIDNRITVVIQAPPPVIPYIDKTAPIIPVDSQVIDNTENAEEKKLTLCTLSDVASEQDSQQGV